MKTIKVKPVNEHISYHLPKFSNKYAAGADLFAERFISKDSSTVLNGIDMSQEEIAILEPEQCLKIGTNISIELPKNTYLDICSRSGLSINQGLVVTNAPARIDNDYRGEIIIGIRNISNSQKRISIGDRVAQCTLHKQIKTKYKIVNNLSNTERGEKGLGSSGIK